MPKKLTADERARRLNNPVAQYLERAFLRWQSESGSRKSQRDFAEHIGLGYATLGKLMRGEVETPEPETVRLIGNACGPDIYALLGEDAPDPAMNFVVANWWRLDVDTVAEIGRIVERALSRAGTRAPARGVAPADRSRKS